MENVSQALRDAWNNIRYFETGSLQIGIEHPLDWYVAFETPTNKALVIISPFQIDDFESSKSISTVCRKRDDGKYYISFQLVENTQEDVFIDMCSNLIEYSSDALTEKEALKRVAMRYKQWRRLMEYRNQSILSDEKRRGLIGELLYLRSVIENSKPLAEAVAGWVGPDGADQDFVYEGKWREVKTTKLSSDQIVIHSLEQLGQKKDVGELLIYRVDSCAPETDEAFTLRKIIKWFIDLFEGDMTLIETFISKLSSVGYIDLDIYDKFFYKCFETEIYDVDESFPRITREDIRPEIIKAEYTLSISSIVNWKRG